MKNLLLFISFLLLSAGIFAQKQSAEQYISQYKNLAIREMKRTGIPASITLAQGILESGSGNSRLATKGNNHFGIKCHDWTGKRIFEDDDRRNECFRKYRSAYESFIDHSNFLSNKSRYAFLFAYGTQDYKAWARGLKRAGYATAHDYPRRLIDLIERYQLYQYDRESEPAEEPQEPTYTSISTTSTSSASGEKYVSQHTSIKKRIRCRNCVPYFIVQQGDSYTKIAHELGISRRKIARYNDFKKGKPLVVGEPIYLKKKKKRTPRRYRVHIANGTETMHKISQRYAVRLKTLLKNNGMKKAEIPYEGQHILLR